MDSHYQKIDQYIDTNAKYFHEVSNYIHANPELAFAEQKAHDYLARQLADHGFEVQERYLDCDTAFRGSFERTPGGPVICIICEYDALPDVGHACGHNLIAETGIAAGLAVKHFLDNHPAIKGKIVVMGTPAEERGAGKEVLIERGAFKDIDCALMSHPANSADELTPLFIGVTNRLMEYHGKAAHAAGYPWDGKNALDGAVTCYNGLAMLRQHIRPNCKVHAIIRNGGAAANVVPEYASLEVYYRAPTVSEMDELGERVVDCAEAGARLSNTTVRITQPCPTYLPLLSNSILAGLYRNHAERYGIQFGDPSGKGGRFVASSDIGNVSWTVPAIQPIFHIDAAGPNHSKDFTHGAGASAAQKPTLISAKAMALASVDILCKPDLIQQMKQELSSAAK